MTRTRLLTAVLLLALLAGVGGLVLGGGRGETPSASDAGTIEEPFDGFAGDDGTVPRVGGDAGGEVAVEPQDDVPGLGRVDRLSVRGTTANRRLVNADGAQVLLRGVNVNAFVDYGRSHTPPIPVRARDLEQMAALGLNVMRLGVSWSKVMPEPGRIDRDYLRPVTSLVRRAARHRIYTVISMHSDRYAADLGTGTEFDGAPRWAVFTDGQPCGDPRPRYYTACAAAAARHFYDGESVAGRRGVDWYADAVVAVARAGRAGGVGYSGIDLINEPTDPDADPDRDATARWSAKLHALQRTVVRRLRADGERAPVWIQPQGPRSTGATVDAVLPDLGDEDQVVYAPHAYIDVYDGVPNAATADRMRVQYERFGDEAQQLRAATVVGEFPGAAGGPWEELRREHLRRQLRTGFGGIAWLWKQPSDGYGWGTLDPDGGLRADTNAAQVLSAPRLLAGDRTVEVRADPSGAVDVVGADVPTTVDVWLGTGFGGDAAARSRYRLVTTTDEATVTAAWRTQASLGGTPAAGTTVRVSLPAGRRASRFVPGD